MPKPETATGSVPIWIKNRNTGALYRIYTAHNDGLPRHGLWLGARSALTILASTRFIAKLAAPFTHHATNSGARRQGYALVWRSKAID
jgi:hypothetical protein